MRKKQGECFFVYIDIRGDSGGVSLALLFFCSATVTAQYYRCIAPLFVGLFFIFWLYIGQAYILH